MDIEDLQSITEQPQEQRDGLLQIFSESQPSSHGIPHPEELEHAPGSVSSYAESLLVDVGTLVSEALRNGTCGMVSVATLFDSMLTTVIDGPVGNPPCASACWRFYRVKQ